MEYHLTEKVTITAWLIAYPNVSVEANRRRFRDEFNKEAPPRQTLVDWKNKLLTTGSLVHHKPRSGRPTTASGDENTQKVVQAVREEPTTSVRRLSDELDISQTSVFRILKKSKLHPYKPHYSQYLCDGDDDRRREFCETILARCTRDPAFLRKITFSDECSFHLNGRVNKHNVHYWAEAHPHNRITCSGKTSALTVINKLFRHYFI